MTDPTFGERATLVDALQHWADARPDKVAFRFLEDGSVDGPRTELTYGELERRARAIGRALTAGGGGHTAALLAFEPGLDFVEAFFGCLFARVVAVPAPDEGHRTKARLERIAAHAGVTIVLTSDFVRRARQETGGGSEWISPPDRDAVAMLQYTSGSTGAPKGVVLSHANLMANQVAIAEGMGHRRAVDAGLEGDLTVFWLPLYHDLGLIGHVLQTVYMGETSTLLSPHDFLKRPLAWLEAVARFRAHTSGGPSFAFDLCLRHVSEAERDRLDLSCWKNAFLGAEPISWRTLEAFRSYFAPSGLAQNAVSGAYGLAEATVFVSADRIDEPAVPRFVDAEALALHRVVPRAPSDPRARAIVDCGRTSRDDRVAIVDPETRKRCAPDEVGEVWVSGTSVARGYFRDPEATEEAFGFSLEDDPGRTYLRTGDLGFVSSGHLFLTGRSKDMLIVGGRNHYPGDLEETAVRAHHGIRPGGCVAFPASSELGEQLCVVAEVNKDLVSAPAEALAEVSRAIREGIARDHGLRVHRLVLVGPGAIPKTSSGKKARRVCRSMLEAGELEPIAGEPRTRRETDDDAPARRHGAAARDVRSWLEARLGRATEAEGKGALAIDPDLSFQALGLGSIELVEITGELASTFGLELPHTFFYDHPTIAEVARAIEGGERAPAAAVEIDEPIAIVGIGCRFPGGADTPEAFWDLLVNGVDAVREVPRDRWNVDDYYDRDPAAPGKMVSRRGGFVEGIESIDAAFHELTPGEARVADPQLRLLLETAWEAFERAGVTRERLRGSDTGVYVGLCGTEYGARVMRDETEIDALSALGTVHSAIAGRLSYWLGLEGPNFPVDTACSSSLVALHLACAGLRRRECSMALCAGVNVLVSPAGTIYFSRLGALSPDGVCRSFDEGAGGYVRGEGAGAIVLKRLADARRGGDRVLAVVRGSAVDQDGRSNGFTAPSGRAQKKAILTALARSGLDPSEVDYVEAHGTGTPVGDPIEAEALGSVFRGRDRPLYLGSVKTNIGHLEGAAGIASVIKCALMLERGELCPSLHFVTPNPRVAWSELPLEVVTEARPWPRAERPRSAGVSAFGFSGTNAHVVLEQAPPEPEPLPAAPPRRAYPILLSARSRGALAEQRARLGAWLRDRPDSSLSRLAYSLAETRTHFEHRWAAIVRDVDELVALLEDERERASRLVVEGARRSGEGRPVCFLFTGQGAQRIGMGRGLYREAEGFRRHLDACAAALAPHLDAPLVPLMFGEPVGESRLAQTGFAQPAVFALEVALARWLIDLGIVPDRLVGHSVGEIAAACVGGVLSLEDAAELVCARGRLMQALPPGEMIDVAAPGEVVSALVDPLAGRAAIAADNGPGHTVVSGLPEAIGEIVEACESRGLRATRLAVSHAFHSPMMDPMLEPFAEVCARLRGSPPRIPIVSTVTGCLSGDEIATPSYWVEHARRPVLFAGAIRACAQTGPAIFCEIGPRAVLSTLGPACVGDEGSVWVPTLRTGTREDWTSAMVALATVHAHGGTIRWRDAIGRAERLDLPTYPFQRKRHWVDAPRAEPLGLGSSAGEHALSGRRLALPGDTAHRVLSVGVGQQPYLRDHVVHGRIVVPGAFWIAVALAAARHELGADAIALREVRFPRALVIDGEVRVHVTLEPAGEAGRRFTIASGDREPFAVHASGRLGQAPPEAPASEPEPEPEPDLARGAAALDVDDLYRRLADLGIALGPAWRWTRRIQVERAGGIVVSSLAAPEGVSTREAPLHPAMIDNVLAAAFGSALAGGEAPKAPLLPFAIDELVWRGGGSGRTRVRGAVRASDASGATLDFSARDAAGRPILAIRGFVARAAPRALFFELAGAGDPATVFDLAWRELETPGPGRAEEARGGDEIVLVARRGAGDARAEASRLARELLALAREVGAMRRDHEHDRERPPRVVVVTEGAVAASPGDVPDPALAVVWGFCRSWRLERPSLDLRLIDVAPETSDEDIAAAIGRPAEEWQIAIRGGRVLAPRLVRADAGLSRPPVSFEKKSVLVTGGTGHLGMVVAERMIREHAAGHVILVARSPRSPEIDAKVEALGRLGARITRLEADVADARALACGFAEVDLQMPLAAVIHAAGVLDDRLVEAVSEESLERVLAPKIAGALNLEELTKDMPIEAFVCFSSLAGVLGSPGQASYAAANAFLDAFCFARRDRGLPVRTIAWGPWSGGGMASSASAQRGLAGSLGMLDPQAGAERFSALLAGGEPHRVVAALPPPGGTSPIDVELPTPLRDLGIASAAAPPSWWASIAALSAGERVEAIARRLRSAVVSILGSLEEDDVDMNRPLTALGIDSLAATELRAALSREGIQLSLPALFDAPSIAALAERISVDLARRGAANVPSAPPELGAEPPSLEARPSAGQRRLWFLRRLEDDERYHLHLELSATGPLSADLAERTLALLVERHEALRTIFPARGGDPSLVVLESFAPVIAFVDLSPLDEHARTLRLDALRETHMRARFDVEAEPAFRMTVVRLGQRSHRIFFTQHHLLTDGPSIGVFARDWAAFYAAVASGREPEPLASPPYSAFVEWERSFRRSDAFARGLSYWRRALAGLDGRGPGPEPARRPRSRRGDKLPFAIDAEDARALVELAAARGTTLFAAMTALFAAALARATGRSEVALGTAVANRPPGFAGTAGFFANTIVLFERASGEDSFDSLLERWKETVSGGLEHASVPFDDVVRAVRPARADGESPLFRFYIVQEAPLPKVRLPEGLTIEPAMDALDGSIPGTAKFDVTLIFTLEGGRIHGSLEYRTDRRAPAAAARLRDDLVALAARAARSPTEPLSACAPIEPPAKSALVGPSSALPAGDVYRRFSDRAARAPREIALESSAGALSSERLGLLAERFARRLVAVGVRPGATLGLLLDRGPEIVVAMLGCLRAGIAFAPISPAEPPARVAEMLASARIAHVATTRRERDRPPTSARVVFVDEEEDAGADDLDAGRLEPIESIAPESPAYVIFTSGSTGRPKAAAISRGALANYVSWKVAALPPRDCDRLLWKTAVGFDSSVGEVLYCLSGGVGLVIAEPGVERDVERIAELLARERITVFKAVPSLYRALLATGRLAEATRLRVLVSGGEALTWDVASALVETTGAELHNFYGPAEAAVSAVHWRVDPTAARPDGAVPIGAPIANARAYVLDDGGRLAPPGAIGELALGGACVGLGYVGGEAADGARFVVDPFSSEPDARMYRTGDRARLLPDGLLEFVGRRDRQTKIRGERIDLGEVEQALRSLPEVVDAAVVHDRRAEVSRLVAFVEGPGVSGARLRDSLAARLPASRIPAWIEVGPLPRLASGKADYQDLSLRARREREAPPDDSSCVRPAGTSTERALAEIWSRTLGVSSVLVDDDFFALGGDSFLAAAAMQEAQARFVGRLRLHDLFACPTIRRLSELVDAPQPALRSPSPDVDPDAGRLRHEVRLPIDVRLPADRGVERARAPRAVPPRRVLLTGATGFLGAHLLTDLLRSKVESVVCLVRAGDEAEAGRRLEEALASRGLDVAGLDRVEVVAGTLDRRSFGLPASSFAALGAGLDAIVHAGAWVHHAHRYETLRAANVGGTREVVRLAAAGRPSVVHFVSTMEVLGRDRRARARPAHEAEETIGDPPLEGSGYARSKWVAERILRLAHERGLPMSIHRPSLVFGHSTTGFVEARAAWPVTMLRACIQLGVMPEDVWPALHLVPVDYVAAAVVRAVLEGVSDGAVYHLSRVDALVRRDLSDALARRGIRLGAVPYREWHRRLSAACRTTGDDRGVLLSILPHPDDLREATEAATDVPPVDRVDRVAAAPSIPTAVEQIEKSLTYLLGSGQL